MVTTLRVQGVNPYPFLIIHRCTPKSTDINELEPPTGLLMAPLRIEANARRPELGFECWLGIVTSFQVTLLAG